MKKLSFFALAMTGMLFAACADKDVIAEGGQQGELRPDGYMALSLNLPTTPTTRAVNDDYADGTTNEYNVKDCALLLFQGKTEAEATLINAQAILLPNATPDDDETGADNITTSYKLTAKVEDFDNDGENNLYALALLNYKDIMTITTDNMPQFKNVIINGVKKKDYTLGTSAKLSDFQTMEIDGTDLTTRGGSTNKNYFFMTNAILSTAKGGVNPDAAVTASTFDPATLVQLAKMERTKIFETKALAEAEGNSAGDIIVERAVAKATLKVNPTKVELPGSSEGLAIAETSWTIDNTQPSTYVARNPGTADESTKNIKYHGYKSGGSSNYRFIGSANVNTSENYNNPSADGHDHGLSQNYYRTYWCIDPLYDEDALFAGDKVGSDESAITVENDYMVGATSYTNTGEKNPLYCYENTFDVKHQSYKNTTRAIIKVVLSDKTEFWTVNGEDNILGTQAEATTHVEATIANNSDIVDVFDKNLEEGGSYSDRSKLFKVEYKRNDATGQLEVVGLELSDVAKGMISSDTQKKTFKKDLTAEFAANAQTVIDYVNERVVVRHYKAAEGGQGAEMYYVLRFKHFAGTPQAGGVSYDDLAPWNIKDIPGDNEGDPNKYTNNWEGQIQSGGTDKSYPTGKDGKTPEQNYLGRYGMVRNNWYDVEITAFNKLGFPADPSGEANNPKFEEPDTPDDSISEYLSAKIHILSWAKRFQQWGF